MGAIFGTKVGYFNPPLRKVALPFSMGAPRGHRATTSCKHKTGSRSSGGIKGCRRQVVVEKQRKGYRKGGRQKISSRSDGRAKRE